MFPDVAAKDRLFPIHERRVLVRSGGYLDAAVGVGHEPRPAAAKAGRTGGFELRLKFSEAATRSIDRICQRAARLAAAVRDATTAEALEGVLTILVGVNVSDPQLGRSLMKLSTEAGFDHYLELQSADASTLARQAIARAIADHEETKRQKEAAA